MSSKGMPTPIKHAVHNIQLVIDGVRATREATARTDRARERLAKLTADLERDAAELAHRQAIEADPASFIEKNREEALACAQAAKQHECALGPLADKVIEHEAVLAEVRARQLAELPPLRQAARDADTRLTQATVYLEQARKEDKDAQARIASAQHDEGAALHAAQTHAWNKARSLEEAKREETTAREEQILAQATWDGRSHEAAAEMSETEAGLASARTTLDMEYVRYQKAMRQAAEFEQLAQEAEEVLATRDKTEQLSYAVPEQQAAVAAQQAVVDALQAEEDHIREETKTLRFQAWVLGSSVAAALVILTIVILVLTQGH